MAVKTWTNGSLDGDLGNGANFSPTGALATGDDLFFVKSNNSPVTTGLDQSAGAGLHLGLIQTERGFTAGIGATGNPLIITCNRLVHRGEGQLWYKDGTGTSLQWTREVVIASPEMSAYAAVLDGAAIERILLRRGRTLLAGSLQSIARLEIGHENNPLSDVDCEVASGAKAIGSLVLNGGRQLLTNCAVNMATCRAGLWRHESGDIGILVNDGSTVVFNPDAAQGEIFRAILKSGTLDTLQTSRAKTIRRLLRMPGARLLRDRGLLTVDGVLGGDGEFIGDTEEV
ncbi:MAG: hypothetical protein U0990_09425 [Candidatus Nanopelagicales bacterium]|nr:hypothetical protein [Candidatus Nanopelagicales bacterium]